MPNIKKYKSKKEHCNFRSLWIIPLACCLFFSESCGRGHQEVWTRTFINISHFLNICLKGSRFPNCRKISPVILVFKNTQERSAAKNLPSCKSFLFCQKSPWIIKLMNNTLANQLRKYYLSSDVQYGFKSSHSTQYFYSCAK